MGGACGQGWLGWLGERGHEKYESNRAIALMQQALVAIKNDNFGLLLDYITVSNSITLT